MGNYLSNEPGKPILTASGNDGIVNVYGKWPFNGIIRNIMPMRCCKSLESPGIRLRSAAIIDRVHSSM
ncbi:hypothetical protein CS542_09345 [Pedobacter sp. IW39]|nr:hypothetical protein CS542_09345 [Pedobacter sp. IW39]